MRRIAVYIPGASDLGLREPTVAQVSARVAELSGLDDDGLRYRLLDTPVASFVATLRTHMPDSVDGLILPATKKGARATEALAVVVRRWAMLQADSLPVQIEQLRDPTPEAATKWMEAYLDANDLEGQSRWELSVGGGATGLLYGILSALLLRAIPVRLWPAWGTGKSLDLEPQGRHEGARRWMVRHRYYDAMARLDDEPAWQALANRQAVDVAALISGRGGPDDKRIYKLDIGTRRILHEAVQAAYAEGLVRGSVTDGAAARAWIQGYLRENAQGDVLKAAISIFASERPKSPSAINDADDSIRTLLTAEVLAWHRSVVRRSHGALHISERPAPAIRALQNSWSSARKPLEPLLDEFPDWAVAPPPRQERLVVLLRALSPPRRGEDGSVADPLIADQIVLDGIVRRLDAGEILSFEIMTKECPAPAARAGVERIPVLVENNPDEPALAEVYRGRFLTELGTGDRAALADEVAVLLPAGRKSMVIGAILAALDWSLYAAAPLTLLYAEARHDDVGPILETTTIEREESRALAVLGIDSLLADVAGKALRSLDLSLAASVLGRGSARLRELADRAAALHHEAFGIIEPSPGVEGRDDRTSAAEMGLAVARIRLCRALADRSPWNAAYTAASVMDHTFRMPGRQEEPCPVPGIGVAHLTDDCGWVPAEEAPTPPTGELQWKHLAPWETLRSMRYQNEPVNDRRAACRIRQLRNDHPLSHGLDPHYKRLTVPDSELVLDLLVNAEEEVRTALLQWYRGLSLRKPGDLLCKLEQLTAEVDQRGTRSSSTNRSQPGSPPVS